MRKIVSAAGGAAISLHPVGRGLCRSEPLPASLSSRASRESAAAASHGRRSPQRLVLRSSPTATSKLRLGAGDRDGEQGKVKRSLREEEQGEVTQEKRTARSLSELCESHTA